MNSIDVEGILALLRPGGTLALGLKGFEARPQQLEMLKNVLDGYTNNRIALIEAGTGTGKSIAYLLPAIIWGLVNKERTVISTNTINLQEQLLHKDIPALIKALGIDIKVVLAKGMGNYLCRRKYTETMELRQLLDAPIAEDLARLEPWAEQTQDGSTAELRFQPHVGTWEMIGAEWDTCNQRECRHFKKCHFFNARENAKEAQLIIVNHHLLCADLARRMIDGNYTKPAILPEYQRIIIDEAHHLEEVATKYFAKGVSQWGIQKILARIGSERHGRLTHLRRKMIELQYHPQDILTRINLDLPQQRKALVQRYGDTFALIDQFRGMTQAAQSEEDEDRKVRLRTDELSHPFWREEIQKSVTELVQESSQYTAGLKNLLEELKEVDHPRFVEQSDGLRHELKALTGRLSETAGLMQQMVFEPPQKNDVRYIETQVHHKVSYSQLVNAQLDIAQLLANGLFKRFPTTVLCSATLTTNSSFDFIRERLGLKESLLEGKTVSTNIYESPFDYPKQALLAIPTDIPDPSSANYNEAAIEGIWNAIHASRGGALILFTSFQMLRICYQHLEERLASHGYSHQKQGDQGRHGLLQWFKSTKNAVLFATHSFWEGVDIVGDALRCVVIVKIPFQVPTEPIMQARCEQIAANGGKPFLDYSLPLAIVKFKQGFGRLIRHKSDRGCIVCLDSRLHTKFYGSKFLDSIPDCTKVFDTLEGIKHKLEAFYADKLAKK